VFACLSGNDISLQKLIKKMSRDRWKNCANLTQKTEGKQAKRAPNGDKKCGANETEMSCLIIHICG